jgi:hypothetical protein
MTYTDSPTDLMDTDEIFCKRQITGDMLKFFFDSSQRRVISGKNSAICICGGDMWKDFKIITS